MCAYSACTVHMQTHFPQNVTVRLKFSVHNNANCGAIAVIASTTYMTIVELFYECPPPLLPRDDDNH